MPHCAVVGCNNQAKKKDDPSVCFHCFPEKPELYRAWVNAVKRTTLPKDPRVCSRHFDQPLLSGQAGKMNQIPHCDWLP